jgi:hypothetical protein
VTITTLKRLEEDTARDLRDDFNEFGWDHPRAKWKDALKFSRAYGLVNSKLKRMNRAATKILTICKREFVKGQQNKLKITK